VLQEQLLWYLEHHAGKMPVLITTERSFSRLQKLEFVLTEFANGNIILICHRLADREFQAK
jgi:hypothetical protein